MATIVIILILGIIIFFAVRGTLKHMKGEGGCCGGGCSYEEEQKVLENPILGSLTISVEGMHCQNCKNSIERNVNKIEGASCRVNLKKKTAVVQYDREIDPQEVKRVIERLDFIVGDIMDERRSEP